MVDQTSKRFAFFVVVGMAERRGRWRYWRCRCDCGNFFEARADQLARRQSCGCGLGNVKRCQKSIAGQHPLRYIWNAMRNRCENPNHVSYKRYGARGIYLCEEWQSLDVFYKWAIDTGYAPGMSIERTDNDRGYLPDNCRWIPKAAQAKNRRSTLRFVVGGEEKCLADITKQHGANYERTRLRIHRGMPLEEALKTGRG